MKTATALFASSLLAFAASATFAATGRPAGAPIVGQPHTSMTPTITQAPPATTLRTAPTQQTAPSHTGQPNQSCGSITAPNTPGNSMAAPGSAFNPDGTAGSVYAGQQPQNSRNPKSVSQYDVACANQPIH